jgi:hypothetical protein
MVQALLRLRADVFEHYSEGVFLDSIRRSARVVENQEITGSGRLLVRFERR